MAARYFSPVGWLPSFLLLLSLTDSARADDWPIPRGSSHEPQPYHYDPKHLKQAPAEFLDDAPACMVYYGVTHLVQPDGTTETIIHEVTRLNGRKGIESLGEYRGITFDPAYQKLTLNEARVLKAGGQVVPVQPKDVKLRDTSTDYQSYDHEKELVISFPNLEVGDLYEVKWTTVGKHPENDGHFFRQYLFGSTHYPVIKDQFQVRLPKTKPFKHTTVNTKIEPAVRAEGPDCYYTWTVNHLPPLPRDEDLPPKEELRWQLVCSTFSSWHEVGQWKHKLRKDCWECTPEIKTIVQQITAGLKSPVNKAKVLTNWVRKKIRYVSVVSATHRYTPSKPGTVLANLLGDCKDQAQLLAVMLREAGLKVHLATLGLPGDGQIVEAVPSPWGTHAILLVRIDGKDHWIDTTSTFSGWDFLPKSDRDRVAYVTDEMGKIEVLRTPLADAADNRLEQTTLVWVQPDGASLCKRLAKYHGFGAITQRQKFIDTPVGECKRLVTAQLQDAHARSQLLNLALDQSNLQALDQPASAVMDFQIKQHFAGKSYLEAGFTDNTVWSRLLAYNPDFARKTELDLWTPFESSHSYIVQLPPTYRFETLPSEKTVESKWGSFRVTVKRSFKDDRKLAIYFHTRLEKARVKPEDFAEFRKFHQQVYDSWRVWLEIAPTKNLDDALAIEGMLSSAPQDIHSARILAKLYQQHGYLADAQRVLKQILQHYPEDTALWEMAVAATGELEEEEAVYRQMVQRFPHEPKYGLALGKTCMFRGKYGDAATVLEPLTRSAYASVRGQAFYLLAKSAFRQKQPAQALEYLLAGKKTDPDSTSNLPALQLTGQVYEQLEQPAEALKAYQRAVQVQPNSIPILAALIRLELAAKRPHQVVGWLRQYSLLVKGDVEGLTQAAAFHLHLGQLDDAFDLALQARDLAFYGDTQKILGLIYLQWGMLDKALFHLDRANLDGEALQGIIKANLSQGNLGGALDHAAAAGAINNPGKDLALLIHHLTELGQRKALLAAATKPPPGKQAAWSQAIDVFLCAEYAYHSGLPGKSAKQLLDQAFSNDVQLGPAHALRGLLLLEKGQLRLALKDAEKAVQLSPKEARAYYVRGRCRYEMEAKGALDDLKTAAQLSHHKDAFILHWLAAAQFDAGLPKEALATQQQAVKLRPEEPELAQQLQKLQEGVKK